MEGPKTQDSKATVASEAQSGLWATGRARRRWRGSLLGLGLGLLGVLGMAGQGNAQDPSLVELTDPHRLVRRLRTTKAGEFSLDSTNSESGLLYVPQKCVGTRPCPLFVVLTNPPMLDYMRDGADTFGIILLLTSASGGSMQDYMSRSMWTKGERDLGLTILDGQLKYAFEHFAVDVDKVALMGRCATGDLAAPLAFHNSHIFSRLVMNSSGRLDYPMVDPRNTTNEFLSISSLDESQGISAIPWAQRMRQEGHRAKITVGFRWHAHQWEDYYFILRWLHESWTIPNPAARSAPAVVANPLPALTPKIIAQMTAFWTRFIQEPESITITGRRAHLREVVLPLAPAGEPPVSLWMMDMAALAAKYPAVAADLKQAGLTAQQHDAYRVALASAALVRIVGGKLGKDGERQVLAFISNSPGAPISVLRQNVEYLGAHPDQFEAFATTGIWTTP